MPADQASFTDINSLWFSDPAAARAQVGGGVAPAADTDTATADAPVTEDAVVVASAATTETATEEEVATEPDSAV